MAFVYMLKCSDGSYYIGSARASLEARIADHNARRYGAYAAARLPVKLVWSQEFLSITDAIAAERQIKGWSRVKKEALIDGNFARIRQLAKRGSTRPSSFETAATQPPQDEE
jgi:putative endonuclease